MRRTLAEFEPRLDGEKALLKGLLSGELVPIGGEILPDDNADQGRQLRADFIRYLLLGGCDGLKNKKIRLHEKGLQVTGALITGTLDLEGCCIACDIALVNCRFENPPILRSAEVDNLFLNGSNLPGFAADRLQVKGSVFLRRTTSTGQIRLLGTKLGGDIECDEAELTVLSLDRTKVDGAFFLREGAKITELLDLTDAEFGSICDEAACWPEAGNLLLDRCRYGAFTGNAPVAEKLRLNWLSRHQHQNGFEPQPWEQCAKVLREMGHRTDARKVLIDKEKRQRADRRKQLWDDYMREDYYALVIWDWLLAITVRYGHRPLLAFGWLFGLLIIGTLVFGYAQKHDAIKPNDVRIIRAAEWVACAPDYKQVNKNRPAPRNDKGNSQLECFLNQAEAKSYPRFNPLIYSADTLLPIVAMEMQSYWIPDDRNRGWGKWARRFLWLQIIAGWALSLLAVAGFSGLIKSD